MSPKRRLCSAAARSFACVTLAWVAVACVTLGCGEDPPPPAPTGPVPVASLDTVDLCGDDGDTAAFVREALVEGGAAGVVAWFRRNVSLPANVRTCRRVQPEPQLLERVLRVEIHRVTPQGTRVGSLLALGASLQALPLGVVTEVLSVYPDDGSRSDAEGVQITISSFPD